MNKPNKVIKSTAPGDTVSVDGSNYTVTVSGDGSSVLDAGMHNRTTLSGATRALP